MSSVDKVLSHPLHIDPTEYVAGGNGTLADVFHPQARYFSIQRVHRQLIHGPYAGEHVYALLVEGVRPRVLNLGVRRFFVALTVNRNRVLSRDQDAEKIEALEAYLLRR